MTEVRKLYKTSFIVGTHSSKHDDLVDKKSSTEYASILKLFSNENSGFTKPMSLMAEGQALSMNSEKSGKTPKNSADFGTSSPNKKSDDASFPRKRTQKDREKSFEEDKNMKKPMTNKERAQRARERQKAYKESLEYKVKELEEQVHYLSAELETYKQKERLGLTPKADSIKTAFDSNVYENALKAIKNSEPEGK